MKIKLSSLATVIVIVVATSVTNALAAGNCGSLSGHTYALMVQGAEFFGGTMPTPAQPIPTPIVGLAAIEINPACQVSGEMIYDDNDTLTAPAACAAGGGEVAVPPPSGNPTTVSYTGSVPCFNGTMTQLTGTVTLNSAGGGKFTITDTPGVTFAPVAGKNKSLRSNSSGSPITLGFNISEGLGGSSFSGTSISTDGPPPGPPILTIAAEQDAASTSIPPNVATAWGSAPWVGQRMLSCDGFSFSDDPYQPGAYNSVTAGFVTFPGGSEGGWFTANGNNSWIFGGGAASSFPQDLCYAEVVPQSGGGPYADGTVDTYTLYTGPYGGTCLDGNYGWATSYSSVAWGAKGASSWSINTGVASQNDPTFYNPQATGICVQQPATATTPAPSVVPSTMTVSKPGALSLAFKNPSARDCAVALTELNAPGGSNFNSVCCLKQQSAPTDNYPETYWNVINPASSSPAPCPPIPANSLYFSVYPGYTSGDVTAIQLSCSAKPSATANSIKIASPNCPALNNLSITVNN